MKTNRNYFKRVFLFGSILFFPFFVFVDEILAEVSHSEHKVDVVDYMDCVWRIPKGFSEKRSMEGTRTFRGKHLGMAKLIKFANYKDDIYEHIRFLREFHKNGGNASYFKSKISIDGKYGFDLYKINMKSEGSLVTFFRIDGKKNAISLEKIDNSDFDFFISKCNNNKELIWDQFEVRD